MVLAGTSMWKCANSRMACAQTLEEKAVKQ
jgi:hypothetical protein